MILAVTFAKLGSYKILVIERRTPITQCELISAAHKVGFQIQELLPDVAADDEHALDLTAFVQIIHTQRTSKLQIDLADGVIFITGEQPESEIVDALATEIKATIRRVEIYHSPKPANNWNTFLILHWSFAFMVFPAGLLHASTQAVPSPWLTVLSIILLIAALNSIGMLLIASRFPILVFPGLFLAIPSIVILYLREWLQDRTD